MSESAIQTKIKGELVKAGWFVTKLIKTSTNGIPDLLAIRGGRVVFIEVKQPGNKPTPLQAFIHQKLQSQNIEVITAFSLLDISHLCPLKTC